MAVLCARRADHHRQSVVGAALFRSEVALRRREKFGETARNCQERRFSALLKIVRSASHAEKFLSKPRLTAADPAPAFATAGDCFLQVLSNGAMVSLSGAGLRFKKMNRAVSRIPPGVARGVASNHHRVQNSYRRSRYAPGFGLSRTQPLLFRFTAAVLVELSGTARAFVIWIGHEDTSVELG